MLKIDNANSYIELTTVYYDKNGVQHTKNIFYCRKRDVIKKAINRFDLDFIGANNEMIYLICLDKNSSYTFFFRLSVN